MITKRSFTLIELIMAISIIAILAVSGAWLMINTVRNSVFIPNQLNMDKLVKDALDIMVEGNAIRNSSNVVLSGASGLRFSKAITAAAANDLTFTNQDGASGTSIRYYFSSNILHRTIGAVDAAMPSYIDNSTGIINMSGNGGILFTYYDASGNLLASPVSAGNLLLVRSIKINLIANPTTGGYNTWQGSSEQRTSIVVDRLQ